MIITRTWEDIKKPLTEEQKKRLEEAKNAPIVFDKDCPELTEEQIAHLKEQLIAKQEARKKQIVSLRISQATISKAKQISPSYTSLLTQILENAFSDPELLKRCL